MGVQKRIKQIYAAMAAKIHADDQAFITQWLNGRESELFWAMNLPDQRHALNVAYTALTLNESRLYRVDRTKLIKCCLLHDVGKVRGDVSTFDKVMAVIVYKTMPEFARKHRCYGRGGRWRNLCHALYIYEHHARLGYEKLMQMGNVEIAEIIVRHHEAETADDGAELLLLREADELN